MHFDEEAKKWDTEERIKLARAASDGMASFIQLDKSEMLSFHYL